MVPTCETLADALTALSDVVGVVTVTLELRDGGEKVVSGSYKNVSEQLTNLDKQRFFQSVKAIRVRRDPASPSDTHRP